MSNNNNDTSMFKIGDIVIGSSDPSKSVYSSTGAKVIKDGVSIYGNEGDLREKKKNSWGLLPETEAK